MEIPMAGVSAAREGGLSSTQAAGSPGSSKAENNGAGAVGGSAHASDGWRACDTVFTNAKAGMDGVDKEKVKQVVYEMSKDSAHFANEQRKQQACDRRVEELQRQAEAITPPQLATHTKRADSEVLRLELQRQLDKVWLHVDMDAFFAAVEERDNPLLKESPMAVGGIGMICTANYKARQFGVRSAMPGFIAKKLCPQLIFVKHSPSKYSSAAEETRAVFREYDPNFQAGSLDEAYLDVTALVAERDMSGAELAAELRAAVHSRTRLTCSVGIAPNKRLAKICSDMNKPNGQFLLPPDRDGIVKFMETLPLRKVGGIGKVSEQALSRVLSISTCGQLLEQRGALMALFSLKSFIFYMEVGLGMGATEHSERPSEGEVGRKGISCERTFRPIHTPADMEAKVADLSARLAEDMSKEQLEGRTLTLKLKGTDFQVHTRAFTSDGWLSSSEDIQATALKLLRAEVQQQQPAGLSLRLMGVRMSQLIKKGGRQGRPAPPGQKTLTGFVCPTGEQPAGEPTAEGTEEGCSSGGSGRNGKAAAHVAEAGQSSPWAAAPPAGGKTTPLAPRSGSSKTWDCSVCTLAGNPAFLLRCTACDSLRSASQPQSVVAYGLGTSSPSPLSPLGGSSLTSGMSGRTGGKTSAAAAKAPAQGTDAPRGSNTWQCRVCTLAGNPSHLLRCPICDSLRSSSSSPFLNGQPSPLPPTNRSPRATAWPRQLSSLSSPSSAQTSVKRAESGPRRGQRRSQPPGRQRAGVHKTSSTSLSSTSAGRSKLSGCIDAWLARLPGEKT